MRSSPNCSAAVPRPPFTMGFPRFVARLLGRGHFSRADVGDKAIDIGRSQICYSPVPDRRRDGSLKLCRGYRTWYAPHSQRVSIVATFPERCMRSFSSLAVVPASNRGSFAVHKSGLGPGNALFVPPPPNRLDECLSAFERFLHADDPTSRDVLARARRADRLA